MALCYWQDRKLNSSWWRHFRASDLWRWGFYPTDADHLRYVAQSGIYQWGFSYEFLFVAAIINSSRLPGFWILGRDCVANSELCKKGRRLGLSRAVPDISEAMREELGRNICAYSESELTEALKNRLPIMYYVKHGTEQEPGHIELSSRTRGGQS